MPSYPNIDKSAFRKGEYVGYGAGRVWRVYKSRKTGVVRWIAAPCKHGSPERDQTKNEVSDWTLGAVSAKLAALPIESGKLLPTVNAVEQ